MPQATPPAASPGGRACATGSGPRVECVAPAPVASHRPGADPRMQDATNGLLATPALRQYGAASPALPSLGMPRPPTSWQQPRDRRTSSGDGGRLCARRRAVHRIGVVQQTPPSPCGVDRQRGRHQWARSAPLLAGRAHPQTSARGTTPTTPSVLGDAARRGPRHRAGCQGMHGDRRCAAGDGLPHSPTSCAARPREPPSTGAPPRAPHPPRGPPRPPAHRTRPRSNST
jgi:hypothetical protein